MTATTRDNPRYADWIDRAVQTPLASVRDSILGHAEALEELGDVWGECRHPDWDGYGALPAEQESLRGAYVIIQSLPLGFPRPSIGAEPDGHLTLEWRKSVNRILSVSVDPDGLLHYAGLYGPSKKYGTLPFYSSAPYELIRLVREL